MYEASQTIQVKQTNTFSFIVAYTDDNDLPLSLEAENIKAHIKDAKGVKVCDLVVNPIDLAEGVVELQLPQSLKALPLKPLYMDIRLEQAGIVRNSDILEIEVLQVVTNG